MFKIKYERITPTLSDSANSGSLSISAMSLDSSGIDISAPTTHDFDLDTSSQQPSFLINSLAKSDEPRHIVNIDPGIQHESVSTARLNSNIPELFDILSTIYRNYFSFIPKTQKKIYNIVPTLVGSAANLFHPAITDTAANKPNDLDIEIFCLLNGASSQELNQFLGQLATQFIPEHFASPSINVRTTSCQFSFFDLVIVDVKFTIFINQSIQSMMRQSMISRRICPKANMLELSFKDPDIAVMHFFPLWLDFTNHDLSSEKTTTPEDIAYALVFYALHKDNPMPMTNRLQSRINQFKLACDADVTLKKTTQQFFTHSYMKKRKLSSPAQYEIEFNESLDDLSDSQDIEVIELMPPTLPQMAPLVKEPEKFVEIHETASPEHTLFFKNYREIDSFCDAIIRQMTLLKYSGLARLGFNPLLKLKYNLESKGEQPITESIQNFRAQYPDIHLEIYQKFPKNLELNPYKHKRTQNEKPIMNIFLYENCGRYAPIISPKKTLSDIKILEAQMHPLRIEHQASRPK